MLAVQAKVGRDGEPPLAANVRSVQGSERQPTVRALVTGGAGFIGSHLVDRLLVDGHHATVYDKVYGGDLFDATTLGMALRGRDVVFHFAANASVRGGTDNPALDLEQNLIGTSRLLEAMRQTGVTRIAFASSSAVYGNTTVHPTPETAPFPIQTSLYAASKVAAEALISAYCHGFGMQATIFRFVPVLGEGYRRGHVYDFWRKLKADPTCIEVLGDGQQRKAYLHVSDVVEAILCGVTYRITAGQVDIFNVSGEETASVDDSLGWICEEMGVTPQRVYTYGSWAGDKPLTLLDGTKLRELGWQPKVSVRDAVVRTVRSFRE